MTEWSSEENVREVCAKLLSELPDDALYELYESLIGIRDFYAVPYHPPAATPPPLSRPAIMLPPSVRVDYPFDPDEIN